MEPPPRRRRDPPAAALLDPVMPIMPAIGAAMPVGSVPQAYLAACRPPPSDDAAAYDEASPPARFARRSIALAS